MKVLLIGKSGQIGFELQRSLAPLGKLVAIGRDDCDLTDSVALRTLIGTVRPDVVVNAAAYTAVDRAESEVESAFAINAQVPGIIGEEAARLGARVIHYSTDYVFNGFKQSPYKETDHPDPLSVYGRSKLAGEKALEASGARNIVFRTSWVIGAHGSNFATAILRLAAERETLNVVADQYGAPTSASLIADITSHVLRDLDRGGNAEEPLGVYHLTAAGETTWHEYATFVVEMGLRNGMPLKLRPEEINPITAEDYPTAARRPVNSRLATDRFRERFNLNLPHWRDGVNHVLQQIFDCEVK